MKKITALIMLLIMLTGCANEANVNRRPSMHKTESQSATSYEENSVPTIIMPNEETPSRVLSSQVSSVGSSSAPASSAGTSSKPASSTPASSKPTSSYIKEESLPTPSRPQSTVSIPSAQTSSKEESQMPDFSQIRFKYNGVTYYNVTVASNGKPTKNDDKFFPDGEIGYYIESGTYNISADVFERIIGKLFLGDGAIRYKDWKRYNYTYGDTHLFDGVIPISKMNDPLFVSMNSPNECQNYYASMGNNNGDTCVPPQAKHVNILPIGAIYLNEGCTLPDDTQITLCFGKMNGAIKFKGEEWKLGSSRYCPDARTFYPLPWQLEYQDPIVPVETVPYSNIKNKGDYWEIKVTVGDFRRKSSDVSQLVGRVLHFWGDYYRFPAGKSGADVEGVAASYQVWIKEAQYAGVLSADVGIDLRDANGTVNQAFSTKSFAITEKKRNIFGHNVCPTCYDSVMDSEKVQQILGMK